MGGAKIRGKSALLTQSNAENPINHHHQQSTGNHQPSNNNLLKIESVVPTITNRISGNTATVGVGGGSSGGKFIRRSNSTLSPSYHHHSNRGGGRNLVYSSKYGGGTGSANPLAEVIDENQESVVFQNGGNLKIKRTAKEKEKLPDRINLDRRGLTSIPFIDDEQNLRLLSLQHNLINVFQVPTEKEPASTNTPPSQDENRNKIGGCSKKITTGTLGSGGAGGGMSSNRNVLATSENKIQLGINSLALNCHYQKNFLLKRSNSFINGHLMSTSNNPGNFLTQKSKLQHMMSISSDNLLGPTNTTTASSTSLTNGPGIGGNGTNTGPQNNKISNITFPSAPPYTWPGFSISLQNLVFLDLYDNQIDRISNLDGLRSLTVLLLGKNRIVDISGIVSLKSTLRVLDLHGNRISNITQKICQLQELKSLNLAGNLLRQIVVSDFAGMISLKELNLKRNRIKKMSGFDDLRSLERLWLCHNDLQKIDDMSAIAKAVNLKEVTIENNPISLGGDCISFLVSYLPNLVLLSQMQVTEQVKRAANAWRKSKEISDSNFSHLSNDVCQNIRREEVISNARTSWELLRSQQIKPNSGCPGPTPVGNSTLKVNDADTLSNLSDNVITMKKLQRQRTMAPVGNSGKRFVQQSFSTDVAPHTTTTIEEDAKETLTKEGDLNNNHPNPDEFFRLPPILAPFLEKTFSSEKMNSQGSSLGPNIDSGSSYYSSDNDETKVKETPKCTPPPQVVPKSPDEKSEVIDLQSLSQSTPPTITQISVIGTPPPQIDESKNMDKMSSTKNNSDSSSIITNSSDEPSSSGPSCATVSSTVTQIDRPITTATASNSQRSTSKIRSASVNRKFMSGSLVRAQTARGSCLNINTNANNINSTNNSQQNSNNTGSGMNSNQSSSSNISGGVRKPTAVTATDREREQGGDYLIEICGRYLNVYGLGAIKFVDKQWNTQKANDVHTVKFSYINFNNIAGILYRVKVRFPNAENFVFRETNITCIGQLNALAEIQGINSLIIDPEGNPICVKEWRNYAIYRLSHWGLKQINTIDITDVEIQAAEQAYVGLSDLVVWSLPDTLLQPLLTRLRLEENCQASKMSAKEWLLKADPSLKCVVGKEALQWKKTNSAQEEINFRQKGKNQLASMMENTCNAVEKLQKLEVMWTSVLVEMIRNTLLDYSQIDVYVRNLMEEIMK